MNTQSTASFTAFVGIDWADRKHDFCIQASGSDQRTFGTLEHSPEEIAKWAYSLRDRFGGPIAICLELAKGPLIYALQRFEFLVLFPVHPSTLAKYREAFTPSRAKDDPTDAEIALDILLRHPEKLQPIKLQSSSMRELATLVEERRCLVNEVTSITNRMTSTLKQYYPQVLDWFEARDTLIFCDFLDRWPTLKQVKRARRSTIESFFRQHNGRRVHLIEERIQGIRAATALTEDESVIRPCQMVVQALVEQLRVLLQAIDRFDTEIAASTKSLPDYDLFASLPGAGHILAPRLLVAFGEDRDRYASAAELQRAILGLPRWLNVAVTSAGYIGGSPVLLSCVRHLSNGQARRYRDPSGQKPTIDSNAAKVALIAPRYERWHSSGYGSSIDAGRRGRLMTNPFI